MAKSLQPHVIVIGAGIGGLMSGLILAGHGVRVTLLERAAAPGGKMRLMHDRGRDMDAGPTVFTLKHVFEEAFASIGLDFDACVPTRPAKILARHAWDSPNTFDLPADAGEAKDSVRIFFGPGEADGFSRFCADSARVWNTLRNGFVRDPNPSFMGLIKGAGLSGLPDLLAVSPFARLWPALGRYFQDRRLQQLFGRYATYVGSSPFMSPATLMLIAHVEQSGVWMIEGGMHRLAQVCAQRMQAFGATIRYNAHVARIMPSASRPCVQLADGERLEADAIVFNGDVGALAQGLLGEDMRAAATPVRPEGRSLSAVTWTQTMQTSGLGLVRHNVFFSNAYAREFEDVRAGRLPADPTAYVCAQDRADDDGKLHEAERLLVLVNAPAKGDRRVFEEAELEAAAQAVMKRLRRCGLSLEGSLERRAVTAPDGFDALLPGTGGALYGRASHGWRATFQRDGVRSKIPRLYFAGGSIHPGAGVPMAALSGWTSAKCVMTDLTSA